MANITENWLDQGYEALLDAIGWEANYQLAQTLEMFRRMNRTQYAQYIDIVRRRRDYVKP